MEKETIGFEWKEGVGKTSSISLKNLNDNFNAIETGVAYRKSYEIVSSLNAQYEFDKINLLLDNLGIGSNVNTSLKKAFKLGLSKLDINY